MLPETANLMPASDPDGPEGAGGSGGGRSERIGVGGGDDAVVRIQLAARWAETFAPETGDSLTGALRRFRQAFEYLDAVTHGIEPSEQHDGRERGHETPSFNPAPPAPEPPPPVPAPQQPPVVSSADQPLAPEAPKPASAFTGRTGSTD